MKWYCYENRKFIVKDFRTPEEIKQDVQTQFRGVNYVFYKW